MSDIARKLTREELNAECGTLLPAKEVLSLLDLNVDIDLALDFVAPIDLAVAANLNVAAPINAAVGANVLSFSSYAAAQSDQGVMIDQIISGEAIANAPQSTVIDQSNDIVDGGATALTGSTIDPETGAAMDPQTGAVLDPVAGATDPLTGGSAVPAGGAMTGTVTDPVTGAVTEPVGTTVDGVTSSSLMEGDLLNIDVRIAVDADLAAPIAGAVAANANVVAPIAGAVSANVGSFGSEAIAVSNQQAIITQTLDGVVAEATAAQDSQITQ